LSDVLPDILKTPYANKNEETGMLKPNKHPRFFKGYGIFRCWLIFDKILGVKNVWFISYGGLNHGYVHFDCFNLNHDIF